LAQSRKRQAWSVRNKATGVTSFAETLAVCEGFQSAY
jgi:hypothetical protein